MRAPAMPSASPATVAREDTLDRALADFAESYGDQTERDHAELVKAIKAGRVKAAMAPGD